MRHRVSGKKLSKSPAHRKAMFRNMLTALFRYERIRTTQAKAKELRPIAEKMLTRARVPSLHNRRLVARDIHDKEIAHKLFTVIAPRFISRPGGYTRILKLGQRADSTEMVLFELVERTEKKEESAKSEKAKTAKKKSNKKEDKAAKAEITDNTASVEAQADNSEASTEETTKVLATSVAKDSSEPSSQAETSPSEDVKV